MFYLAIFLIIVFFSSLEILGLEEEVSRYFPWIVLLILLVIAGFRYETGVDWRIYASMFQTTAPIDEITTPLGRELIFSTPDYGYCLLISIVKYFGGSIQTVFFIISLITYIFLYKSIVFFSEGKTTSLLIYFSLLFFVLDMSGMRQSLALSMFFYALRFIYNRNLLKFTLLILVAASFHWSAYLLFLLYFIIRRYFSTKALIAFFILSLAIYVLKVTWFSIIIEKIAPLLGDLVFATKLLFYSRNDAAEAGRAMNLNTILNIVFYIGTFSLLLYYRPQLEKSSPYFNLFLNIYICQIFTFFFLFEFAEMSERLRLYLMISNIVLLPSLIFLFDFNAERVLIFTYVLGFAFFSCKPYILNAPTTISYHPYQNFIIYETFHLQSTGEQRLDEQAELNE